jgi:hypothetical protein
VNNNMLCGSFFCYIYSLSPFSKAYVRFGKSLLYKAHAASQESLSAGINVVEAKSYLHGAIYPVL